MQEARNHHFVPKLLLRPWLIEESKRQLNLWGYYWDQKRKEIACKRKGLDSFCCQIDLLSLSSHQLGRDAIERIFFGQIDTKGAVARNALLEFGPSKLDVEQRFDFARLIVSLESRRPTSVRMLRTTANSFSDLLDTDTEVRTHFEREGIDDKPSVYFEKISGSTIEDRILTVIQKITDSPRSYEPLLRTHWHLLRLGSGDGSFLLADRPLIRDGSIKDSSGVWALPLTPKIAFLASQNREALNRIERLSKFQVCRHVNIQSALQAERFVFSTETNNSKWLSKYLGPHRGR
ncbi:DUF4238 domain-containing protein [Microvirga terricola]|uniref:DUF4238 domain-containing protein n=1 Tax=Microvirga terricola TaxID=2719797 RepID=A0ABX0VCW4_9HYPH|nr:DUF4238 domain-containing protein [Microvirga terricola]NIX77343.1 DUF4238 domain-containing protein [Microvirga terricola]